MPRAFHCERILFPMPRTTRHDRLRSIRPLDVRRMLDAHAWRELNSIEHDIGKILWFYRTPRSREKAPRGWVEHLGALLIEMVRRPIVDLDSSTPVEAAVSPRQVSIWHTLMQVQDRRAHTIAEKWLRSRHRAARAQGAAAYCALPRARVRRVLRLIDHSDAHVTHEAMCGLSKRCQNKGLSATVRSMLHRIVAGRGRKRARFDRAVCVDATDLLIDCDSDRALRYLCSSRVFSLENPAVREVLVELTSPFRIRRKSYIEALRRHIQPRTMAVLRSMANQPHDLQGFGQVPHLANELLTVLERKAPKRRRR